MSSELFRASDIRERDGDVISAADDDSDSQVLPSDNKQEVDDDATMRRSANTASKMLYESDSELLETEVIQTYETEREKVEKRQDQGIDTKVAEYQIDPTGVVRMSFRHLQNRQQAALNHNEAEKIRQTQHQAKVAKIEQIQNPEQRKRALDRLLAEERVAAQRRRQNA